MHERQSIAPPKGHEPPSDIKDCPSLVPAPLRVLRVFLVVPIPNYGINFILSWRWADTGELRWQPMQLLHLGTKVEKSFMVLRGTMQCRSCESTLPIQRIVIT